MRKRNIIVLGILVLSFLFVIPTNADSGWDFDYDSGGSSWSSSDYDTGSSWSSSDYDTGSSWSSGDYDSGSSGSRSSGSRSGSSSYDTDFEIVFWFFMFLFIYGLIKALLASGRTSMHDYLRTENHETVRNLHTNISNIDGAIQETIDKILPGSTEKELLDECFNKYKQLQETWSTLDLDNMRKLLTDEMYNMYSSQIKTLKLKEERNIMENINYVSGNLMRILNTNNIITITLNITVTQKDYVVDKNNKVIRGSSSKLNTVCYQIEMVKKQAEDVEKKCPHCGAEITNLQNNECVYCHSKIINNNKNFVISKKRVITQY